MTDAKTPPDPQAPDEGTLTRAYRAGATERPPAALDARVLAQARAAATRPRSARLRQWVVPLTLAAAVLLGIGVVLQPWEQGEIAPEIAHAPAAPPSAPRREAPSPLASRIPPGDAREDFAAAKKERRAADAGPAALAAKPAPAHADIVSVETSGTPGAYEFRVGVRSPDTGCVQYADWWEVVSEDGRLLYRRVLLHSHADEQPFVRSGGPVPVQADTTVWVRAHMNTAGYGGVAYKGSVARGFAPARPPPGFAAALARQPPLPERCAY